jgi:Transposase domain (DUF772)
VPERQAVELVKYHLGWKLALHLSLGDPGFHPTTLVYFRQRLLEHAKSDLAFGAVLGGAAPGRAAAQALPPTAGLERTSWRPWPTSVAWNACARRCAWPWKSWPSCCPKPARPAFWPLLWDRYVDSKLDYRSSAEALQDHYRQAGADGLGLLQWLEGLRSDLRYGTQIELLAEVLGQRFALKDVRPEPLEQSEGSAVQSPHDLRRAVRGQGPRQAAQGVARL